MKFYLILILSLFFSFSAYAKSPISKDCTFKDIKLYGKIKIVENFPDLKVKVVNHFPKDCGKWQFVENFPDFKIKFVDHFPDIKIKFVENFPGIR